jgi:hypothetical protein
MRLMQQIHCILQIIQQASDVEALAVPDIPRRVSVTRKSIQLLQNIHTKQEKCKI